jgi:hypothetical protein
MIESRKPGSGVTFSPCELPKNIAEIQDPGHREAAATAYIEAMGHEGGVFVIPKPTEVKGQTPNHKSR